MDNAANTTVIDQSGKSRNGTAVSNTSSKATTGPNGYLTSALSFDGTSDYIDVSSACVASAPLTIALRGYCTDSANNRVYCSMMDLPSPSNGWYLISDSANQISGTIAQADTYSGVTDGSGYNTWKSLVFSNTSSTLRELFVDGVSQGTDTSSKVPSGVTNFLIGVWRAGLFKFQGSISETAIFSRDLSQSEAAEIAAGPEPVNTSAPSLTGTQAEGQILSCTSGTWGIDSPFSGGSNGTITYNYQWTRSDDGSGTGEANIGGATSSTYTLQAGDVGKYLRCYVRASNDGGYDVAADTPSAFTGAIASSGGGGGGNRRRRALICGRAS